jgi:hypothetical protein
MKAGYIVPTVFAQRAPPFYYVVSEFPGEAAIVLGVGNATEPLLREAREYVLNAYHLLCRKSFYAESRHRLIAQIFKSCQRYQDRLHKQGVHIELQVGCICYSARRWWVGMWGALSFSLLQGQKFSQICYGKAGELTSAVYEQGDLSADSFFLFATTDLMRAVSQKKMVDLFTHERLKFAEKIIETATSRRKGRYMAALIFPSVS